MILVTGATGLLGTELIKQLSVKGEAVKALYRNSSPTFLHPVIEWVKGDILDMVFLEELLASRIETVYHCAGLVSFSPKQRDLLYKINCEGTATVVNAFLDNNIRKLVHVSSIAAIGRSLNNAVIDESTIWNSGDNNSEYAKSKRQGEMEVWRGIAEGLKAVIVNPSIILGAGNWDTGSTKLFKTVYEEFEWYSTGVNGFVDVYDVAKIMILLMESSITEQRFVVSSDNIDYRTIFTTIATIFNKRLPYKEVTPLLGSIIWRLVKLRTMFSNNIPMITKETVTTALSKYYYNNQKLLKALPEFQYQPTEDSLRRICTALTIQNQLK